MLDGWHPRSSCHRTSIHLISQTTCPNALASTSYVSTSSFQRPAVGAALVAVASRWRSTHGRGRRGAPPGGACEGVQGGQPAKVRGFRFRWLFVESWNVWTFMGKRWFTIQLWCWSDARSSWMCYLFILWSRFSSHWIGQWEEMARCQCCSGILLWCTTLGFRTSWKIWIWTKEDQDERILDFFVSWATFSKRILLPWFKSPLKTPTVLGRIFRKKNFFFIRISFRVPLNIIKPTILGWLALGTLFFVQASNKHVAKWTHTKELITISQIHKGGKQGHLREIQSVARWWFGKIFCSFSPRRPSLGKMISQFWLAHIFLSGLKVETTNYRWWVATLKRWSFSITNLITVNKWLVSVGKLSSWSTYPHVRYFHEK